jgi:hypothetical protein
MILRSMVSIGLLIGLCAGDKRAGPDPLGPRENWGVYREVKCTVKAPDGTCNEMSCKKDEKSDCTAFVKACLKNKHKADGTSDSATCTRTTT